jgi:hypothetical protein
MEPGMCTICLCNIEPVTIKEEEKEEVLVCHHTFHKECIVEWLKIKHNCPVCRAKIEVPTPEARQEEMTMEEILNVPDHYQFEDFNYEQNLGIVRHNVLQNRQIRRLDLNQNGPVESTARKINNLALNFFRF